MMGVSKKFCSGYAKAQSKQTGKIGVGAQSIQDCTTDSCEKAMILAAKKACDEAACTSAADCRWLVPPLTHCTEIEYSSEDLAEAHADPRLVNIQIP